MGDTRLRLDFLIHLLLESAHLIGRRTFLSNENAAGKTTVSRWKQRERQMSEEKPETENATEQDRNGQPGAIEKSIKSATVGADNALNEIGRPLFHARAFVTGFAFTENTRTHQRRQS